MTLFEYVLLFLPLACIVNSIKTTFSNLFTALFPRPRKVPGTVCTQKCLLKGKYLYFSRVYRLLNGIGQVFQFFLCTKFIEVYARGELRKTQSWHVNTTPEQLLFSLFKSALTRKVNS